VCVYGRGVEGSTPMIRFYNCCVLFELNGWIDLYLLPLPMVQDVLWKADSQSACQKISCFLYGTRRFINVFTRSRHPTSWASRIQFASSTPISLRSVLMLSICIFLFRVFWHRNKQSDAQAIGSWRKVANITLLMSRFRNTNFSILLTLTQAWLV